MRARNVKPGFFKNPDLADAGPAAQLLSIGLWCMADREGRVKDQPRVIKAEVFPYYDVDVNGELTVLSRLGHIRRYVSAGIPVIEVLNFKKHQCPHHTEKASDLPAFDPASACIDSTPDIHREITVNSRKSNGGNPSDSLIPDSLNPDSLNPDSVPTEHVEFDKRPATIRRVFDHWRTAHDHPRAKLDAKRSRVIREALMAYTEADLCQAITGYLNSPHHMGQNDRGTKFDDLELFLRDAKHIDAGLKFYEEPPRQLSTLTRQNIAAAEAWLAPEVNRG